MEFLNETTYVDKAESVLKELTKPIKTDYGEKKPSIVTTSKIRNILAMAADIYDKVLQKNSDTLDTEIVSRIEYLRVRMIYEAGRDNTVKQFINKSNLCEYAKMVGNSKANFILFYRYMESLIAFHRYYGGKDQ